ncbi:DUF4019 domain-containing protein [Novosphingobium mathurense]|uniref:DUF4019 domain-containing protein n=1 Tax=Novosphingobium mathurense TaxID=428990 RepID=A0A1U6H4L3_9SPHN|nr:DUF4019 domain-containing protein [Novosphingobium mathurense]CDO37703.1 conserved hypothetical protein [Novosphingobium sp. KN65.2]SLJ90666.1 Protein of unknown function [Novosphingobium mathurense]
MYRVARYLMPFAAAAMLAGCGIKESVKDAQVEVGEFHAALDGGQWKKIWIAADPDLRKGTDKAQFEKLLEAVHRKLGAVRDSRQVSLNVNSGTGGTFVTVIMQTTFAKGTGTEEFVFRRGEGKAMALVRYNIQSQDMMLN